MSKERAQRRAVREREAAEKAAARSVAEARAARARARRAVWSARLRPVRSLLGGSGQQTGLLAQRRRTRLNVILMAFALLQVVVWIVRPDWQARLGALVISAFIFPLAAVFAL
ncbi:MAG: hypothetical protein JWQ74_1930 [Marmoricola sp.]|nr:hypothetical protein [Marmoricola sp.]